MVHVRTDLDQGNLWSSKPSLVIVLDLLRIGILDCKSQLDIVDCFLEIIPPQVFYLKTSCFIDFSKSSHLMLFIFMLCLLHVMNV